MISHFGQTITKATEYLKQCGKKGALTGELAEHLGCTAAHASRAMNMGESRGVFGHYAHPGDGAANRKRWYMADMRPDDPPRSALTGRRKKNALTVSLPWRRHAGWDGEHPADMSRAKITIAVTPKDRFHVDPPKRSNLDPRDCHDWARAAAPE